MISPLGKPHTTIIGWAGFVLILAGVALHVWWLVGAAAFVAFTLLMFFRDPRRRVPVQRGLVVAPADGRITSIHDVAHFEPFDGPAKCVRIFLSVLDVHVNRSPCYGRVASITHKPGKFLNALRPESAELNESVLIVLDHPTHHTPVAAIRQVAGMIARRIVCAAKVDDILQRGERFGLIKFGSTTEVYLPDPDNVEIHIELGQYVWGGETIVAKVNAATEARPVAATNTTDNAETLPSPSKGEGEGEGNATDNNASEPAKENV
ncbi:MAG: phosphatidylserine decarboxylase family protein [Phycisphaera sp.]|nr:phosphatidylserine decarboxylase family protein [Phycisphaera sp.]